MKKVAKELNELMGLSPAIDIELEGDALIEKIKEAADELIEEDEEQLSKRTVTKLKKLGLWINQDAKEEDKVKPEKVKPTEAEKEQIPEKPKKVEKPKKAKTSKKNKYTRVMSVCDAIKMQTEGTQLSISELAVIADDLFTKNVEGKKSNVRESKFLTGYVVGALKEFDINTYTK